MLFCGNNNSGLKQGYAAQLNQGLLRQESGGPEDMQQAGAGQQGKGRQPSKDEVALLKQLKVG